MREYWKYGAILYANNFTNNYEQRGRPKKWKFIIIITVILSIILGFLLAYYIVTTDITLEIEMSSNQYTKDDFIEYHVYLVNNNVIGKTFTGKYCEDYVYLWNDIEAKKEPSQASEGGCSHIGVQPFSRSEMMSGGFIAEGLVYGSPYEDGIGTYYMQAWVKQDGKEMWSNVVSFEIIG